MTREEIRLQVAISVIQGVLETKHGVIGEVVPSVAVAVALRIADAFVEEWYKETKEQPGGSSEKPNIQWSEDDETAYGDLIWCIEQAKKSAKDENDMGNIWFAENWVKNHIKSLRPKPHWKPSEEQLTALKLAYEDAFECPESGVPHLLLKSLLNDLKKL